MTKWNLASSSVFGFLQYLGTGFVSQEKAVRERCAGVLLCLWEMEHYLRIRLLHVLFRGSDNYKCAVGKQGPYRNPSMIRMQSFL